MTEQEFVGRIEALGGRAYIVGGWVRDRLRQCPPKDKDYVVAGISEVDFLAIFPGVLKVGKAFPVYLQELDGRSAEVAFARLEEKSGSGYKGFNVSYAPEVTIEADLYRRDTTMNSIALCLASGALIDPHHGAEDIERGLIRATSAHFLEDPVRALRAARQAAETGFRIEPETVRLMSACKAELLAEPRERIVGELAKALASARPAVFFRYLQEAGLLAGTFSQIFALIGQTQPAECHPEGDAFAHSLQVVDAAAALSERPEVRFAALVHDLGKGLTPREMLPHHYGHEAAGIRALSAFNKAMTLPRLWIVCAEFAIREHMRVTTLQKPGEIVDFLLRLEKSPLGIDGFNAIVQADHGALPTVLTEYPQALAAVRAVRGLEIPSGLKGGEIGAWVRQRQIAAYQKR